MQNFIYLRIYYLTMKMAAGIVTLMAMTRAIIPVFLVIALSLSCSAIEVGVEPAIARGFVYVNIINNPPEITDIGFSPEVAYSDSVVECVPAVIDEVPKEVRFEYRWHINGNIVDSRENKISGFREGESVSCEALPIDVAGQRGEALSKVITIKETPLNTKVELAVFNAMGVKINAEKMLGLESQGLGAMTGYVVEEMSSSGQDASYMGILVALVLLFVLVDINLVIRYIIKRRHQYNRC
jgi:hypothetical protein